MRDASHPNETLARQLDAAARAPQTPSSRPAIKAVETFWRAVRAHPLMQQGLASRLVIGANVLVISTLLALTLFTGSMLRARMFRSVDIDLEHHARTYSAMVQDDLEFLTEEASVIANSETLEPAIVTRSSASLRRILRPFSQTHEFDSSYVLDSDGVVLAHTGDDIADPQAFSQLPILMYAARDESRVDMFESGGALWIAAARAHRTRVDRRLDAFVLIAQRADAEYLKEKRLNLGPDLALSVRGRLIHSFDDVPDSGALPLPDHPSSGSEYTTKGLAFRSMTLGSREYRGAGFATSTDDGTPFHLYVFEDTGPVSEALQAALTQMVAIAAALMLAGSLASVAYARRVARPLTKLAASAQAIALGQFDLPVQTSTGTEVGQLAGAFEQMRLRVREMINAQQAWNQALEERVQEKTAEIRALSVQQDELLHSIITAREEENRRVARELHDETSQNLAALIALTGAARHLPPEQSQARIAELRPLLADTLSGIKRIMLNLRPALLDDQGLLPALRWHAHERLEQAGVAVDIIVDGAELRLTPEIENCLFRIGQEAMTNIARHADARRVELRFGFTRTDGRQSVDMSIRDDGRGFDPARVPAPSPGARTHLGLLGMRERASLIGAIVSVQSAPGAGTCIRVHAEAAVPESESL